MSVCACAVEKRARRSRLVSALLLLGCAAFLAWLGPLWHLPWGLALLGTLVLWGCAGAMLLYRGEPGAGSRYRALLLPFSGVLLGAGLTMDRATESSRVVLVECFLPPGVSAPAVLDLGPAEGETASTRGGTASNRGGTPAIHFVAISYRLDRASGRKRLGDLTVHGEDLSEDAVSGLEEPLHFVNGVFCQGGAQRRRLRRVIDREARAGGPGDLAIENVLELPDGTLQVECRAPAGLTPLIVLVEPQASSTVPPAVRWQSATALVVPQVVSSQHEHYVLTFVRPGGVPAVILVSREERVVGVAVLPVP